MTVSTFGCDIFVRVTTDKRQTVVYLRGAEEIQVAIQYILLGFIGYCLSFVSQMLDKPIELIAWGSIASEWSKVYAIELAGAMLCGLLKTIQAWG